MKHNYYRMQSKAVFFIAALLLIIGIAVALKTLRFKKVYYAEDFGITEIESDKDSNNNGFDDYSDIVTGAKIYLEKKPEYKSEYYVGGYPTDNYSVCTDVIWAALLYAGYDLKAMVDADIAENPQEYFINNEEADPNIDFRRVRNLKIFFERNEESLTTDLDKIDEWQAGDIVTFEPSHIAIISDKRNKDGIPYILHQSPLSSKESDYLLSIYKITGHYRIIGE